MYCSLPCKRARMAALASARPQAYAASSAKRRKGWEGPCRVCGTPTTLSGRAAGYARKVGYGYCSPLCTERGMAAAIGAATAITTKRNAPYYSARMRANNPMRDPEVRARVGATLRERAWKPPTQGGNGRPPPVPQQLLADALGWPMEVVLLTATPGYRPFHYKLDIANTTLKVCIEVDGGGHAARTVRAADARKQTFLEGRGWCVLRFLNREVMADLAGCVQTVLSTTSKWKEPTPTPRRG